jgi:hypothetical protein
MTEQTIEYGSLEWRKQRLGNFTASEIYKLMGARGGVETQTAQSYILEKVAEVLTGIPADMGFTGSAATEWGVQHEPDAREYYEIAFRCEVDLTGYIVADFAPEAGGTPDGIIAAKNKGIEIKCPYNSMNHIRYLMIKNTNQLKIISPQYYWQVQMYMMLSYLDEWDFVSYDPRFTGKKRMFVFTVKRQDEAVARLKTNILLAINQKHEILQQIDKY